MENSYNEHDVSSWASLGAETTGKGVKEWLVDPQSGSKFLFKEPKRGAGASGDDWAEKVCCELYALVGVPHAQVELARRNGRIGIISRDVRPAGSELILGNEYLAGVVPDYPREENRGNFYTVDLVLKHLKDVGAPEPAPDGQADMGGAAVFVGYLMMDALACAPDRNHTNWGVTRPRITEGMRDVRLAASFDHGSSIAWELQDRTREAGLTGRKPRNSPQRYIERAEGVFVRASASAGKMSALDAFREAERLERDTSEYWLDLLRNVALSRILDVIDRVPHDRMSEVAREYGRELLRLTFKALAEN